jgi:hypothetical protein
LKTLSDSIDIEIKYKNQKDKLIELWLDQQDIIAATVNNMVLLLLFNSSRPLRRNMLRIFMDSVSYDDLEKFITSKKSLLMDFLTSSGEKMDFYVEQYRLTLVAQRQMTRGKLIQKNISSGTTQLPKNK